MEAAHGYCVSVGYDMDLLKIPICEWKYSFGGNCWYMVEKGKQPNAFYRLMQRICLGIIWTKTSGE